MALFTLLEQKNNKKTQFLEKMVNCKNRKCLKPSDEFYIQLILCTSINEAYSLKDCLARKNKYYTPCND